MKILNIENEENSEENFFKGILTEDYGDTFDITESDIERLRDALREASRELDSNQLEEYRTREQRDEEWARRHEQEGIPEATMLSFEAQISQNATLNQLELLRRMCLSREANIRIQEGGAPNEEVIENNEEPQNPRYGDYPF